MNRMEEYQELMMKLEQPVGSIEGTLERAMRKRKHRQRILQPVIGMAAAFLLFVLLVNFSSPVAYACSRIPFLRELAQAVTFSKSLTDAVKNEYIQPLNLEQSNGKVSAKIEYLIVDQKQVNVFFRLDSEVYDQLDVNPGRILTDGEPLQGYGVGVNDYNVKNGELRSMTIDFVEQDVPSSMQIRLNIRAIDDSKEAESFHITDKEFQETKSDITAFVAQFDFLLEFDPLFTQAAKKYDIEQTVLLEGQKITVTDVEVYPTHMRVNVEDDPENTAWLKSLHFYVATENGEVFESASSGVIATGAENTRSMVSYRADSSWFYEAKELKVVITGAEWLRKDMEKIYLNLETGETGELPEGVELHSTEERPDGWVVRLIAKKREENYHHMLMGNEFYDAAGNTYDIHSWGFYDEFPEGVDEAIYFIEEIPLVDYHEKEVWLAPAYSHLWEAEEPIEVTIQQKME